MWSQLVRLFQLGKTDELFSCVVERRQHRTKFRAVDYRTKIYSNPLQAVSFFFRQAYQKSTTGVLDRTTTAINQHNDHYKNKVICKNPGRS